MPSALIRALATRHSLPTVDASSIEAFLAPGRGELQPPRAFEQRFRRGPGGVEIFADVQQRAGSG